MDALRMKIIQRVIDKLIDHSADLVIRGRGLDRAVEKCKIELETILSGTELSVDSLLGAEEANPPTAAPRKRRGRPRKNSGTPVKD